jgi:hypothetical protein
MRNREQRSPTRRVSIRKRMRTTLALGLGLVTVGLATGCIVGCAQILGLDNFTDQEEDGAGGSRSDSARGTLARRVIGRSGGSSEAQKTDSANANLQWHAAPAQSSSEHDSGAESGDDGGLGMELDAAP